ncbi:hypothetical protein HPB49_008104 [Dermacentor silvarum]|uniref:Uncharacterized protein n=1 Tax=Dermacentor silvarum TaxID=543639 RepID=A0ACB8DYD1_DERSI|nr:hypothetical protein HPB49_008104 [Dermacentor silvarum]
MAPIDEEGPVPDSKLVRLWEKHKDLQQRWLKNKINRTLRRELAPLEKEIQDYSSELSTMQWNQLCDSMNGQLSKKNPWTLLKHMLDPQHSKSAAHKRIQKIVHSFPGTDCDLVNLLTMQYLNTEREPGAYIEYKGDENRTLDEDIIEAEVRAALNYQFLWGCQKNPPPRELFRRAPSHEEWEMKTKTYNPEDQIRLAEWADSVAAKQTPR